MCCTLVVMMNRLGVVRIIKEISSAYHRELLVVQSAQFEVWLCCIIIRECQHIVVLSGPAVLPDCSLRERLSPTHVAFVCVQVSLAFTC